MEVKIENSWKEVLKGEFEKPYFENLVQSLHNDKSMGKIIYPSGKNIFKAFELCPINNCKVVILGQDPYHEPGQAMGLSFSVPQGITAPPSLKNIFKELYTDLGIVATSTDLSPWAKQGVLLLNSILTVEKSLAASHSKYGWQTFTDAVISTISNNCEAVVFLLWGNYARSKAALIDPNRHFILQAAHPSPLARGAFFGCKHFSKTNEILVSQGKTAIDWNLTN